MNTARVLACLVTITMFAQSPGKPDPPSKPSVDLQNKIMRVQLQVARIQSQYQACQSTDFQSQWNAANAQIQSIVDVAFKEAKLDKKDYDLNVETFEFVKKPITFIPAPEAKKPEEKKP